MSSWHWVQLFPSQRQAPRKPSLVRSRLSAAPARRLAPVVMSTLELSHVRPEFVRHAVEELRIGFFEHRAEPVERGVGECGSFTEEKRPFRERRQRRREQPLGLRNETVAVALPRRHRTRSELPLLDEHVERAIASARPAVAHGGRRDAKEHVFEGPIAIIGVSPNGSLKRRRYEPSARFAGKELFTD